MAVERLTGCDNIVALSSEPGVHRSEPGVHRRLLYKWRDQLEPIDDGQGRRVVQGLSDHRGRITAIHGLLAKGFIEARAH